MVDEDLEELEEGPPPVDTGTNDRLEQYRKLKGFSTENAPESVTLYLKADQFAIVVPRAVANHVVEYVEKLVNQPICSCPQDAATQRALGPEGHYDGCEALRHPD